MEIKRVFNCMLVAIFIGILCLTLLLTIFLEKETLSLQEKRSLVTLPTLKYDNIHNFPSQFNAYIDDHFGLRKPLIKLQSTLRKHLKLAATKNIHVLEGKHGWYFTTIDDEIEDYTNKVLFTENELVQWKNYLEKRHNWLQEKNIAYVFAIAPDKHTIYPEFMPSWIKKTHHTSKLDQLIVYLEKHSKINILDLRTNLLTYKKHNKLYRKYDTHWNMLGAAIGQNQIVRKISLLLPHFHPLYLKTDDFFNVQQKGGDLIQMLGLDTEEYQENSFAPKEHLLSCVKKVDIDSGPFRFGEHLIGQEVLANTCRDKQHRLVMFRDSFGTALIPYLSAQFNRSVYIWSNAQWDMLDYFIKKESPDIIIEEWVERHLKLVPKSETPPS